MKNDSTLKQLALFVGGIVVVAGLVLLIKGPEVKVAENNLVLENTSSANLTELPKEVPEESNLEEKENPEMPTQKLTVEQKLSVKAPVEMIDTNKNYTATLKTSLGEIVITLDTQNRPQTVNNFVYLARLGFYDGVIFHRVIGAFMIQSGDPLGTGTGGPAYKFADELTAPNSNAKGTISMANAGPNTNGSQFFINLVDNNYLDTKHAVFGKVTGGMDVVENIGKTPVGQSDRPVTQVVIEAVSVEEQ